MLRLLHLADVHLGARHLDLADAAAAQRERQFAALAAAVDLAIGEKAEVVLVAGDLFDTGVAGRRTVERVAAEIARLVAVRIRTVILPGEHDPDNRASVYRAYDLAAMAGASEGDDLVTVLSAASPVVHLSSLDLVVAGAPHPGGGSAAPSLADLAAVASSAPAATWRVGIAHAAPEEAGGELSAAAIAATGLDYLALGHVHIGATGKAGPVTWGVPGSPEQVVVDQPEPGGVLIVTMEAHTGPKTVTVNAHTTGRTTHAMQVVDVGTVESQAALVEQLRLTADPDQVLDIRLTGILGDSLAIDPLEVQEALKGAYLLVRIHDGAQAALTSGELPPADTVAGAFIRSVEGGIADLEATGDPDAQGEADALREVLRLGRRLLAGEEIRA